MFFLIMISCFRFLSVRRHFPVVSCPAVEKARLTGADEQGIQRIFLGSQPGFYLGFKIWGGGGGGGGGGKPSLTM